MAAIANLLRTSLSFGRRLWHRAPSNFQFSFLFIDPAGREATNQVYQFCRAVDDIADAAYRNANQRERARQQLAEWHLEVARIFQDPYHEEDPPRTEIGRLLAQTRHRYNFPRFAFDEIITGVAMDLDHHSYSTLGELRLYCYRVASCVGFLCLAVFGDQSESAQKYAEHLGVALQYTNILRDISEDAELGRVYIPDAILLRYDMSKQDIFHHCYDERFVGVAKEFANEAIREYQLAWSYLPFIDRRALLPAEIMGRTYFQILRQIQERNFNVFTRRVALRRRDKLKIAALALARLGVGPGQPKS